MECGVRQGLRRIGSDATVGLKPQLQELDLWVGLFRYAEASEDAEASEIESSAKSFNTNKQTLAQMVISRKGRQNCWMSVCY